MMVWRWVLLLGTMGVLPAQTLFWVAEGNSAIRAAHATPPQTLYAQRTFSGLWVNQARIQDSILYILASGNDAVFRYRADSLTDRTPWSLPPGSNPYALDFLAGSALVTLWATDQVAWFQSDTLVGLFPTGRSPQDVATWNNLFVVVASGYHRDSYTADSGGIYLHDGTTGQAVDSFPRLCTNPQDAEVVGDTLWLLCTGDYGMIYGSISKILLPSGQKIDSVSLDSTYPISFWRDLSGILYVSAYTASFTPTLLSVDVGTQGVQTIAGIAGFSGTPYAAPNGIVFLEPNYTGDGWLKVLDPTTYTVIDSFPAGTNPAALVYYDGLVVNPDVDVEETERERPFTGVRLVGRMLEVQTHGTWLIEVHDVAGRLRFRARGHRPTQIPLTLPRGTYLLRYNAKPMGKLVLP